MYKEQLASTYNLTLEEIEWVQAFSDTLQAFSTLPLEEQYALLRALCGDFEHPCSISDVNTLWSTNNALSESQIFWLINGLSEKIAADRLMTCLEKLAFQHRNDLNGLEYSNPDQQSSKQRKTLRSTNHTPIKNNTDSTDAHDSIENIDPQPHLTTILPLSGLTGHLVVRIHNPHKNTWSYCNIETGTIEVLSDNHKENTLLSKWVSQVDDGLPCALLSIEWNLASVNNSITRTIDGDGLHGTVSTSYTPSILSEVHRQTGILNCHGGIQYNPVIPTINIPKRTLSTGIQRLSHWTFELIDIGPNPPAQAAANLQWDLTYILNQTLAGNGNRGGHIHLCNSIFVQFSDETNTWLGGTSPAAESILLPTCGGEGSDSHQQRWNGNSPIALKKHCLHEEYAAHPIFNQTAPFNNEVEHIQRVQGVGNALHLWSFIEQSSKAWHEDPSQRSKLEFVNQTQIQIMGTFLWHDHTITLSEHGNLTVQWHSKNNRQCLISNTPIVNEQRVTQSILHNNQNKKANDVNEYINISIVRNTTSWNVSLQHKEE